MGCCISNLDENNKNQSPILENNQLPSTTSKSPPSLEEEECVKQVLSETPNEGHPKPPYSNQDLLPVKDTKYYSDPSTPVEEKNEVPNDERVYKYKPKENCSNLVKSSNYNDHNNQRRLPSPSRRSNPSPPRRYSSLGRVGLRRDIVGENSARRSQSPTMTRSNLNAGRSVSARRTGMSPGRVRMVHGHGLGLEDVKRNERSDGPKESLENPLVSLECFIFL